MDAPKRISVKKAPVESSKENALELAAMICWYYPAYKFREARKLPYPHMVLLLRQARKQEAAHYYTLTQIASAPHTKKGTGVKKLLDHFKKGMKNG